MLDEVAELLGTEPPDTIEAAVKATLSVPLRTPTGLALTVNRSLAGEATVLVTRLLWSDGHERRRNALELGPRCVDGVEANIGFLGLSSASWIGTAAEIAKVEGRRVADEVTDLVGIVRG